MQASNAPSKSPVPFAESGSKNTIPVASQIGITPGLASFTDGFPPLTMTPLAAGGIPPRGQDFNGILYFLSAATRWQQAGGSYSFDSTFAAAIGGYPKGAVLLAADGQGFWISTVDSNTANPDTGGAGWAPEFGYGITAVSGLTNANVTLSAAQYSKPVITLSGTLTGNVQIVFPALLKRWLVVNNTTGAFTVTCKTASGTGVAVAQGSAQDIWGDGTNINAVSGPLATETQAGSAKVATQAQTNAGTDDATIVTPKKLRWGFSVSLGTSGYIVFPSWMGGLIIQWITDSTTLAANTGRSITLPLAFPNNVYSYVVSARNGSVSGAGIMSAVTVGNTGISVYNNGSVAVAGAQTFLIGN